MKIIITFCFSLYLLFIFSTSESDETIEQSLFSTDKILMKTNMDLPVSEATGEISLTTGIKSIDDKNNNHKVRKIKQIFRLNKGDKELYEEMEMSKYYVFYFDKDISRDISGIVKDYNTDRNIEFCEPNFIGTAAGVKGQENIVTQKEDFIPNDEKFYLQWYLKNDATIKPSSSGNPKVGADINITTAWEIESGSEEIIVAICDSGIRDDHPDLKDRIWVNKNEIPNNGIDDDENGYVDDYKGFDFAYHTNKPRDGFGHGTNIATVIGAATNNQIGFAGIDQKCKLMNCKNLSNDNYGEYKWWAESIKYAVDNGASIINMSEGGSDMSKTLETACNYAKRKGVLIVAAMMNKANNFKHYPASYSSVMAIGATDSDDRRCRRFTWGGGSCWGKYIAVVAPGNKIYGLDYEDLNNYEVYWSGTSQATAIVSAIASLLITQNRLRTPDELRDIICNTALDEVGDPSEDAEGWDQYYGWGRVDCYRALTMDTTQNYKKRVDNRNDKVIQNRGNPDREKERKNNEGGPAKSEDPNTRKPH